MLCSRELRHGAALSKKTQLCIAHRLSTVADADMIVVMEDGRVAEAGAPSQLLEKKHSAYGALLRAVA